jgi:hypothetical protein
MCAMEARRSVATTMGFTGLDGLPMGHRCGTLDPGVVLYLLPMLFFEEIVAAGGGLLLGQYMVAGWKSMHPEKQWEKYLDLYEHIEEKNYIQLVQRFVNPNARFDEFAPGMYSAASNRLDKIGGA